MGTPQFAVESLKILLQHKITIAAVITAPDKPAGRGRQVKMSEVKEFALSQNLKILQPINLKDNDFINELKILKADLQIVVAFRMLPEVVWNMPRLGTYNLHASLLPKYRGAAPINWAIINGDTESGITTFKLKHEIDAGSILMQEKVSILNSDTAGTLHDKLMISGAQLLLKTINEIEKADAENYSLHFKEQDLSLVSHAPKLFKETMKINWNESGEKIINLIKGLSPYPTAWSLLNNAGNEKSIKIFSATFNKDEHNLINGTCINNATTKDLKIACSNGFVHLHEIQLEGKNKMTVSDFLRGFKLNTNAILT
ncbi:MAG: methionyl-tRNA formyltransferase [Bacteroidetes bacterium]|nr:methionyl-tRNA formyltransferase [Bacteroidota bacterium]